MVIFTRTPMGMVSMRAGRGSHWSRRGMWTLRSRSGRRRRRSSRSPRAFGSAVSRPRARRSEDGQPGGWPSGRSGLFRPLLELRDEFFDLQLEAFQRREQLRLELPLKLLSFFQEVFYQVAEALR